MRTHVMVIDDSSTFLDLIQDVLEDAGFDTRTDSHMSTDAAKSSQFMPDLLIVNTMFGEEGRGIELVEELKLDPFTAHIPLILCCSPKAEILALEDHLTSHHVRLLLKPFTRDELLATISVLIPEDKHA